MRIVMNSFLRGSLPRRLAALFAVLGLGAAADIAAQANGAPPPGVSCIVSAGNRNAPLAADGSYAVSGIPGNLGAIRARATCSDGSVGQSAIGFTDPTQSIKVLLGPITFGQLDAVPIAASLTAPQRYLNTGEESNLRMTAVAADGTQRDVTLRSAGTVYSVSSDLMASVGPNGLVHIYPAFAPGASARLVASATTEGAVAATFVYVLGPRGRLSGKVVRADGTTTVAGAQVSVLRLQPMEQAGTAVTELTGHFGLEDVSAGSFLISALDPATGDRALAEARLRNEGENVEVTLKLNGQGSVEVRIVDAQDTAVPGASVTFTGLGAYRDVRVADTDSLGIARFTPVAAGDFTVSTRDPATRLIGAAVASVGVGETLPLTLRLQPVGAIDGHVYDVDGHTLREGVQVRLLSRERGILTQSVTGADGAFHFDTLPLSDGPYTLDAFVDGRLRARVPGIVLATPNTAVERDIVFGPVGTVSGRVRDESGNGFANARVTMQSLVGQRLSFSVRSDATGRFVLPAVPVGAFELTAETAQGRSGRAQGTVDSDGQQVALDVVIVDTALTGTVFLRDGQTRAGAGVTVYLAPRSLGLYYSYAPLYAPPPGGAGILRTTTDAQGNFRFGVSASGAYYVQAEQLLERGRSEVVIASLGSGPPVETRVVFLAKGRVGGTVRNAAGALQADLPVTVATHGAFAAQFPARTDAAGHYSVDGVFVGDIAALARDEASGLAGINSGRLDNEGQQITLDLTLAATGTVGGRVLRRDGSVVPGEVELTLRRNGVVVATETFPSGQSFAFAGVPLGDIELEAREIADGDRGKATTRLLVAGEQRNVDVRLVGQGRLRVYAVDAGGMPVAGATVAVTTQLPFATSRQLVTDADGHAVFEQVFAGDYAVSASLVLPLGSRSGTAAGTLLPNADDAVEVVMTAREIGRVRGRVLDPDGVTPARAGLVVRMTPEPFPDAFVTRTDADGGFVFDAVEAGSYTVDVLNFYTPNACPQRDRVRGRGEVNVQTAGIDTAVTVQLIGQGVVKGRVTDAQNAPVAGIDVRMTNPDPLYGANVTCTGRTSYDRVTDADGRYLIEDAPPGDFTITAENATRTLRAEGTGRVDADGDVETVDLTLVDSAVSMPQTFHDANGFRFDITGSGAIGNGHNNVFTGTGPDSGALHLDIVRDGVAVPFTNGDGSIGRLSRNGQLVEVDDLTPSGLYVTRRIYTPRAGYFTRYVEVLRNDSAAPITVSLRVRSHHSTANSNPRVVDSSDGDAVLSVLDALAPDRWVVIDDQLDADPFGGSSIPATAHLFDGAGAAARVASASYGLVGQTGRLQYAWDDITVAPGQRVALMHFVLNQLDRAAAREAASRLQLLPPEAIGDLTSDERAEIRNFAVPEQSALPALPNLDAGVVEGHVYSGDGVTPVEGAQVRFRSHHPLFGRLRQVDSDAQGRFRFRSTLDGTANNYVIPVYAFELDARYPRSGAASSLAQGDFAAGQVVAQQNLIFANRGDVRGRVKRHDGVSVPGARVTLCRLDDPVACSEISPNPSNSTTSDAAGNFLMPANPPRDYFLFARFDHPQGVGLLGRGTTTILPGRVSVDDITIEPTGTISGDVLAPDGTPVVNALVELFDGNQRVRSTRSDTAGHYRLPDVAVGSYQLVASDPISQAAGSVAATVAVDGDHRIDIHLLGSGAVTVHVQYARGGAAANSRVYVEHSGASALTDTLGVARLQLPQGTHRLFAQHPDSLLPSLIGQTTAVIAQPGDQVEATITLQPAGAVHGRIVRPDGTTLAGGFPYTLRQLRGGRYSVSAGSDAQGAYRQNGLPLGTYSLVAYDAQQDRYGEAEFDIAADGEDLALPDLVLLDNRIALPAGLLDANRFPFDVQRSGALEHGGGTYLGGVQLRVNGQPFTGDSNARLEADRRQFAITQPTPLAGLQVTRKIYVPRGAYFARYLEVLENPTAAPITADLELTTTYAGGGVLSTSSGDTAVDGSDGWVVFDDAVDADVLLVGAQMPAAAEVFAGEDGIGGPDVAHVETVQGNAVLTRRWSTLQVPPGGRVAVLHFAVQQINRRGALAAAQRLRALPPEVLADLAAADQVGIHNFTLPENLVSALEPLPALTAAVGGIAYEGDLRTPVRRAAVTVQSEHPLFNRVWGMIPDPFDGCPRGTPVGSLVTLQQSPPNTPNPPLPGSYILQGQLTAADPIALPEGVDVHVTAQVIASCFGLSSGHPFTHYPSRVATTPASATQDVIFDTGILMGTVTGGASHSVTGGRVFRSIDDPDALYPVYVPIASDASYVYPGLPPGRYDVLFDAPAPNATLADGGLRGAEPDVQVQVGQTYTVDVLMQPVGRVDGAVLTANGEPARNARLRLRGEAAGQQYDQCASGCAADTLPKHRGRRVVEREQLSDSLGRYNFTAVPPGDYVLTATDPVSGGHRRIAFTAGGAATSVRVDLLAVGSAELTLTSPAGAPVVDAAVYLTADGAEEPVDRTDSDGHATIPNIPLGSYTLRVVDPRHAGLRYMDRRVAGAISAGGQRETHALSLYAAATVDLSIVDSDNGGQPVTGAAVTVSDVGGTRAAGTTDAQGHLRIAPVPQGSYVLRARARIGNGYRDGESGGQILLADDQQLRQATIDLRSLVVPLPVTLRDANRAGYFVDAAGAGFGLPQLSVDGAAFAGAATAQQQLGKRQYEIGQTAPLSGLSVTRRVFVPRNGYFARIVDSFENRGSQPVTARVRLVTSTAASWRVQATSSGDAVIDNGAAPDLWFSAGPAATDQPAWAFVSSGAGGAAAAPQLDFAGSSGPLLASAEWPALSVAPGQRVALLHFVAQQDYAAGAVAAAQRLSALPPEALDGLDAELAAAIVNFAVPADGASPLPALPALDGQVSGHVFEGDAQTPLADALVTVRSAHPLFHHEWRFGEVGSLRTDAQGRYAIAGVLDDEGSSIALPVDSVLTIGATAPTSLLQASAEATFAAGSNLLVQDLVLASGQIHGRVLGVYQYDAPYAGIVQAYAGATRLGSAALQADGSYRIGGLPAGSYRLDLQFQVREGSGLQAGVADVAVGVGGNVAQDLVLPANGALTGIVYSGANTPVANQYVTLDGNGLNRATYTDAQGRYRFGAVPTGSARVATADPRTGGEVFADVSVSGAQTTSQDLRLAGLGTVTLTARFARGAVAPNVLLRATAPSIPDPRSLGTTDAAGQLVAQLPVGPYNVLARHPQTGVDSTTPGAVVNDGELSSLTVYLKAAAGLRLHATDGDNGGAVLAGVTLQYRRQGTTAWQGSQVSGADGSATYADLAEGVYDLRALAPDGRTASGSATVDASVDGQTVDRTLAVSEQQDQQGALHFAGESHLYSLHLPAGAHLALAIAALPAPDTTQECPIRAQVFSPSLTVLASGYGMGAASNFAQFNETGDLRDVAAPAAGDYTVAVSARDTNCLSSGYRLATRIDGQSTAPQPYPNGAAIGGRLLLPDGTTPVADAEVRLRTDDAPPLHVGVRTAADGRFAFAHVPAARYTLYSVPPAGSGAVAQVSGRIYGAGETVERDLIIPAITQLHLQALHGDGSPYTQRVPFALYAGQDFLFATSTEADGRYSYRYIGNAPLLVSMRDPDDGTLTGDAVVQPADGQTLEVPVRIAASAVEGQLTDHAGTPIADFHVQLERTQPRGVIAGANTDAQGHFRFDGLSAGAALEVTSTDPATGVYVVAPVQTVAGQTVQAALALPGRGKVHGRVRHVWGGAIRGAELELSYVYHDRVGATTSRNLTSDANGAYRFEDVPFGRTIHVLARRQVGAETVEAGGDVTLSDALSDAELDLTMQIPGGSVFARMQPADGVDMQVECVFEVVASGGYSQTNWARCVDGVTFDGVPAGPATVNARRQIDGDGQGQPLPPVDVSVVENQQVQALFGVSVVKGRVTHADGGTVEQLDVSLFDASGHSSRPDRLLPSGEFRFEAVPPGALLVDAQDVDSGLGASAASTLADAAQPVVVDILLPASGTVTGSVVDAEGTAVADASVFALSSGLAYDRMTRSDAAGLFRFDRVALGEVTVEALHPQTQNIAANQATLTGAGQSVDVELRFPQTGAIGGQVQDAGGSAAADACVSLWSSADGAAHQSLYLSTTADAGGVYAFPATAPGPVVVQAAACDGSAVGLATGAVTGGGSTTLDVDYGNAVALPQVLSDSVSGYNFVLEGWGTLQAEEAQSYANQPFAGASLSLRVAGSGLTYQTAAYASADGREITFAALARSGLQVTRRVQVPAAGGYARLFDTFSNTGSSEIHVRVALDGEYADPQAVLLVAPGASDGRYAVQRARETEPSYAAGAAAYVFGSSAALRPDRFDFVSRRPRFGWSWDLTIPAGQSAGLLNYLVVRPPSQAADAQAQAAQIANLSQPGMFDGLSASDRASVRNFTVPQ